MVQSADQENDTGSASRISPFLDLTCIRADQAALALTIVGAVNDCGPRPLASGQIAPVLIWF